MDSRYSQILSLTLTFFFTLIEHSSCLDCFSCIYKYSGTLLDYQCVTEPWKVATDQTSSTITCETKEELCVTVIEYEADLYVHNIPENDVIFPPELNQTRYLYRGCTKKGPVCKEELKVGHRTCNQTCDTDTCNEHTKLPEVGTLSTIAPPDECEEHPRSLKCNENSALDALGVNITIFSGAEGVLSKSFYHLNVASAISIALAMFW